MIPVALAAAYLLGGLPFGYWIVRWRRGLDLRRVGSRNPGATNALRAGGVSIGAITLLLDVLKGVAAVALARALGTPHALLGAVALAAVVGHAFPVWLGFRGGKGVATATGAYLVLAPSALAAAVAVFCLALAASRIVALGSIAAAVTVPLALVALARWGAPGAALDPLLPWSVAIGALVVARHRSNLVRLWTWSRERPRQEGKP
ncbi:MAG: glycerol-3-phosphate 1-O-acyltransferase PlsY [Acidobacteriota bacterium]|nr:glycerol-3-phosphate 1-O-acyltransferase PlsY [Acidobacteriota bacterium]MDH3524463.1 glycerol-3-phosphate 1-O-acyltransferase PlsY [Acidobacteriota bacterium]